MRDIAIVMLVLLTPLMDAEAEIAPQILKTDIPSIEKEVPSKIGKSIRER